MINRKALKQAIAKAYQETIEELGSEVTEVISDPNEFSAEGFTDQDIIDSGRFKESQELNFPTQFQATFKWDPIDPETGFHYGAALFTGFWAWGRTFIPGREYPYAAIRRNKPVQRLAYKLRDLGLKVKFRDNSEYF